MNNGWERSLSKGIHLVTYYKSISKNTVSKSIEMKRSYMDLQEYILHWNLILNIYNKHLTYFSFLFI